MATDLTTFTFTPFADVAEDLNDGLFNDGSTVDALLGDDIIAGAGGDVGIDNTDALAALC